MPLHILALLVIFGLAVVLLAVHIGGGTGAVRLLNDTSTKERFVLDFPNFIIEEILLSDDQTSALVFSLEREEVGLIQAIGQNHLTRMLDPGLLRKLEVTDKKLQLHLSDFTLRKAALVIADKSTRDAVQSRLKVMIEA
ncbi:MAG: hypothetical protein AAF217_03475 [Pseudomonadota bacterium]